MRLIQPFVSIRTFTLSLAIALCLDGAARSSGAAATQPAARESFDVILSEGMVPYTLHVHALNLPLAHGTALTARYEWDFGDASPESRFNQLTGWNAAHVYQRPGNYAVTLTLTDDAGVKREIRRSFIIAPDGRQVIYLAANGNDSAFGDSPERPIRSFSRALKLARDGTEILLRRGDIFDLSTPLEIKHDNILFGAYTRAGAAIRATTQLAEDRPTIRFIGPLKYVPFFSTTESTFDFTLQDLKFDSKYSQGTEKTGMPDVLKPGGTNTTVRNCVFLNVGYGINCNGHPRGVMAIDNSCPLETGLRSYFSWVQGSDHVYLGNTVANSTREHCLRVGGADRILLAYNTFSNLDRRAPDKGNDKLDTSKGAMTIHAGSYVYVANNNILHGELLIGPLGKGDGLKNIASRWKWAVVENNRISSFVYINHGTEHVICRNNLVYRNDWACFIVEGYDAQYKRGNSDITIENNTGFDKTARGNFLRVTGPVDGITLRNNLYIAPNLNLADNLSAPVFVDDANLNSFRTIEGNIWPDLKGFKGVNYVKGSGGYLSSQRWLEFPNVKMDRFETVRLPTTIPTTSPVTAPAGMEKIGARLP